MQRCHRQLHVHKCCAWSHTIEQLTGFSFNQLCPLSVRSKALWRGLPSWGPIKTSTGTSAAPKKLLLCILTCRANTPPDCQIKACSLRLKRGDGKEQKPHAKGQTYTFWTSSHTGRTLIHAAEEEKNHSMSFWMTVMMFLGHWKIKASKINTMPSSLKSSLYIQIGFMVFKKSLMTPKNIK